MYRSIILLVLLAVFLGCQDTKSTKKEVPKTSVIKDTLSQKEKPEVEAPKGTPENPMIASQAELKPFLKKYGEENPETNVRIKTRFGDIEVELYEDTPLHRANFIMLVKNAYFNTTQFHRISPDFVVQGGNNDTKTTARNRRSMGNYLLPNEAKKKYPHVRGAFSAAKYSDQNVSKASSPFEFFIVQSKRGAHHIDGEHTVFGRVTKGMDVIDEMNKVTVDGTEWPEENIYMKIEIIE
ncbi:peptidylprolyl isomerase [uncultured Dokdonia sp.]|uniref:peptidylprolyl isomerase n=1 Tax=uncultured Dokdonia sp. TaxID=575653 RepID=UPI0026102F61|nr:peptidylprolyl isomerase [uncultured Dokdonia sp.]